MLIKHLCRDPGSHLTQGPVSARSPVSHPSPHIRDSRGRAPPRLSRQGDAAGPPGRARARPSPSSASAWAVTSATSSPARSARAWPALLGTQGRRRGHQAGRASATSRPCSRAARAGTRGADTAGRDVRPRALKRALKEDAAASAGPGPRRSCCSCGPAAAPSATSHSHSYEPRCFRSIGLLIEERLMTTARASAPTSTATSSQFGPGVAGAFVP